MQVDMKKIKQALKDKKITYPMLAKMTGVPLPTITNFFTGKTKHPRIDTVQAILSAVGLEEEKPTLAQQVLDTTLANLNIDDFNNLTPTEQQQVVAVFNSVVSTFKKK